MRYSHGSGLTAETRFARGPRARESMRADEIVAALEEPLDDRRAVIAVLHERASDHALAKALRIADDPLTRRLVRDVIRLRA